MRSRFALCASLCGLAPIVFIACAGSETGASPESDGPLGGDASVSVYSYGPPDDRLSLVAGYHRAPGREVCVSETMGDCIVRDCSETEIVGLAVRTGRITVTVGNREVFIDPEEAASYGPPSSTTPALFHGGETVTFDVAASPDVPAHNASVVAPSPVTLTAPDTSKPILIDPTQDLLFTWTGGDSGEVLFATGVQRSDGSEASLTCRFNAAAGTATLPAATLSRLPSSNGATSSVFLWVIGRTEIDAGSWHTAFSALSQVLTPQGKPVMATATVQ